jgi:hypothetical protein
VAQRCSAEWGANRRQKSFLSQTALNTFISMNPGRCPAIFRRFDAENVLPTKDECIFLVAPFVYMAKGLKPERRRTMTEELKEKFNRLTDEKKVAFMKSVMPSFCEIFSKHPQKMMGEIMPMCQEMMKSCNMDMQGMMKTMGMMGGAMRKERR